MNDYDKLHKAAKALADKLAVIHKDEHYKSIWFFVANNGLNYAGPQYTKELESLNEVLAQLCDCQ